MEIRDLGDWMKRRNDFTRITEILIRARKNIKPTNLLSDTRLSYAPGYKLFERLLNLQLLKIVPMTRDNRSPVRFETTEKGDLFIERVLTCYRMIEDDSFEKMIKKVRAY